MTSKSHTFQDHHGDVRSHLRAKRDRVPHGRTVPCFLAFFGLIPGFSLSHSSCLCEIERFQFPFLVSPRLLFLFVRARAFLFCSGWLLEFPAPFSLLSICHPLRKIHKHDECWLQGDFLVTCTVWTKWKCDTDAFLSEYKRSVVASLLLRQLRCRRAASQQLIDPVTLADAKLESTLTNENNKELCYLIADLNSHVKLALACGLTKQNRPVLACLPRCRTTTRSPTVRLTSKLSKATLTSRTEKIRWQNIRLNSCSFTLKERSDSDDMVSQKVRRNNESHLQVMSGMLTLLQSSRSRSVWPADRKNAWPRAWACYGIPWQQHGRLRTCTHHV